MGKASENSCLSPQFGATQQSCLDWHIEDSARKGSLFFLLHSRRTQLPCSAQSSKAAPNRNHDERSMSSLTPPHAKKEKSSVEPTHATLGKSSPSIDTVGPTLFTMRNWGAHLITRLPVLDTFLRRLWPVLFPALTFLPLRCTSRGGIRRDTFLGVYIRRSSGWLYQHINIYLYSCALFWCVVDNVDVGE